MSSPTAFSAIEAYLRTNWTATPIIFENEDWPLPDTPAAFLYVEVFSGIYDQASIGAATQQGNLWREDGTLAGHVLVPGGIGTGQARTYAKAFADLFRGQELGSIRFGQVSLGAGEPGQRDGNYYRFSATIDWERDE